MLPLEPAHHLTARPTPDQLLITGQLSPALPNHGASHQNPRECSCFLFVSLISEVSPEGRFPKLAFKACVSFTHVRRKFPDGGLL